MPRSTPDRKRGAVLAEGVADRIIGLQASGNGTRGTSDRMEENLGGAVYPPGQPVPSPTVCFRKQNLGVRGILIACVDGLEGFPDAIRSVFPNTILNLDGKWGGKYPVVIRSWQDKQERLTGYFQFMPDIRRMIYATNTVGVIIAKYGK